MSLTVKESSGNYYLVEAGMHQARCYAVVDIGTQDSVYGAKHQMILMWVLPDCLHVFDEEKGEEAAVLSRFFTSSLSEKANLRVALQSWRGKPFTDAELKGFEMKNVLGAPCLLNVIHETKGENTRANISSISPVMKGQEVPESPLPLHYYEIEERTGGEFTRLPQWVQKKIADSQEFKSENITVVEDLEPIVTNANGSQEEEEDDIPF